MMKPLASRSKKLSWMKINYKKSKVMLFNPFTSIDFMPELSLDNHELEVVDEIPVT